MNGRGKPKSARAMRRAIVRLDRRRPIPMVIPFRFVLERPVEFTTPQPTQEKTT